MTKKQRTQQATPSLLPLTGDRTQDYHISGKNLRALRLALRELEGDETNLETARMALRCAIHSMRMVRKGVHTYC